MKALRRFDDGCRPTPSTTTYPSFGHSTLSNWGLELANLAHNQNEVMKGKLPLRFGGGKRLIKDESLRFEIFN